jgi:uncharacterized protein YndB with AHSA1/START domain
MLKTILLSAAAILGIGMVGMLAYAATRPDTFRVQRSIAINAPPERILPLIVNLRAWQSWSPYEHKDPAMRRTYTGAAEGPGAVYAFDGNNQVGQGTVTVIAVTPPDRVTLRLDMVRPMAASNDVAFTLVPEGAGTRVTWTMQGKAPFIAKVMHLFFDIDGMVGGDFAAGLARLKAEAER